MSNLQERLQTSWPMLLGNKSNRIRQELLALYEAEQAQMQAEQAEYEAQLAALTSERDAAQAQIVALEQQLAEQATRHQQEYTRLHEQVLQKMTLIDEQAQLYFLKNAENEVK